jgi:multidrug resistance efflux pump
VNAVSKIQPTAKAAANDAPRAAKEPARWNPPERGGLRIATVTVLLAGSISAILYAWQLPPFGGHYEQTDDAYVRGLTTVISPQVSGYVAQVPVQDFQQVKAGDVLISIQPGIFSAKLDQANASILSAMANLDNSDQAQGSAEANTIAQDAAVTSARAQLANAQATWDRIEPLSKAGWATHAQRDQARAALLSAQSAVMQAEATRQTGTQEVRSVIVGRSGLRADVAMARAQARLAAIDLDHTVIRAPVSGQLSQVSAHTGQYVTAGTQLMYLVPRSLWVTANFKEAQTHNIHAGQPATFTVDALGGTRLAGHVESLAPASGSEFAVLPPDNATGNFVKVAQRIAVRIRIDPGQPLAERLRPGMSVVARVRTDGE